VASPLHDTRNNMVEFNHHTAGTMPPSGASTVSSPEQARRRTGWVIAVTLAALAVFIILILYALEVF
jgi:hypothetical protein